MYTIHSKVREICMSHYELEPPGPNIPNFDTFEDLSVKLPDFLLGIVAVDNV